MAPQDMEAVIDAERSLFVTEFFTDGRAAVKFRVAANILRRLCVPDFVPTNIAIRIVKSHLAIVSARLPHRSLESRSRLDCHS
jgi:hypothetical protein